VLRELDRSFDLVRVDLETGRTASGADFYAINPKGQVPVLQLDGMGSALLTEVPAILLYLADLVPDRQLAPATGSLARYQLYEWLSFIGTELHKPFGLLFRDDVAESSKSKVRGTLGERFLFLSDRLADRPFLLGERFTVADAYLYAMLRWCDQVGLDLPIWPNLDDYAFRVSHRPTVEAAIVAEGLTEEELRIPA
jgi:glutathione S-transferase